MAVAAATAAAVSVLVTGAAPAAHGTALAVSRGCRRVATIPVGSSPRAIAADGSTGMVYVANRGGNTVSVISTRTNTVVATIAVGNTPVDIALDNAASRVYVLNEGGTLSVINTRTNKVVATVLLPGEPAAEPSVEVAYPPAHAVYATSLSGPAGSGKVIAVSTQTNKVTGTVYVGLIPDEILADPQTGNIYTADAGVQAGGAPGQGTVAVINSRTGRRIHRLALRIDPHATAIDFRTHSLSVADELGSTVAVISTRTYTVTGTIKAGTNGANLAAIVPSLGKLYLASTTSTSIWVASVRTKKRIATLNPRNTGTHMPDNAIAADQLTHTVFVAEYGTPGAVLVINARTDTITQTEKAGDGTWNIAVDSQTNTVYATNSLSDTVTVLGSCP